MKCMCCGCTDTQACPDGCWWHAPYVCTRCTKKPHVALGQRWRDVDGEAEVLVVFAAGSTLYAALRRCFPSGKFQKRPFLFPVKSMLKGDDGWELLPEAGS